MKKYLDFRLLIGLTVLITHFYVNLEKSEPITSDINREEYENYLNEHAYNNRDITREAMKKIAKKDRPDLAWEQNFLATMNPVTLRTETEKLFPIFKLTKDIQQNLTGLPGGSTSPWIERGPNNVAGRTRALAWDPASTNKVWAGSVTGGLWYNNDITSTTSTWQPVNDLWDNIAITAICFDPNNNNVIYVATGEGWGGGGTSSRGAGIWKSTNGGASFAQISTTTNFYYTHDLVVRNEGGTSVLYVAVSGAHFQGKWHGVANEGLQRSTDGGVTWSQILPNVSGKPEKPTDLDIAADNELWIGVDANSYGNGGGKIYSTINGTTVNLKHTHSNPGRVNLACASSDANYVYAVFEVGNVVSAFKQSTNDGVNWTTKSEPNDADGGISANDFSRGQAWYDLTLDVDPLDRNTVMIGGIDLFKTTNGGGAWSQMTHWYGGFGFQEIHADQHAIVYRNGSSSDVIFGNDGGVAYTGNATVGTPTITHRNLGYNVTQFYSVAMHPTAGVNNFIAGAQDNGSQRFTSAAVNTTTEVTGGDGAFCHIDQTNGNYQTSSYVFNVFYHSSNGGASFSQINNDQSSGKFINPSDLDNNQNILYTYKGQTSLYRVTNFESSSPTVGTLTIPTLNSDASHLSVSPYTTTSTTLFVGTSAGRVYRITNANATPTSTEITGASFPTGSVSCITFGASENEILVTFSNYGVNSVWYTTNGGTTWGTKEGNLPDMPVRWALFNPNNYSEVILATEVGVWSTGNLGVSSPSWSPSNSGLANVRVDMLQKRNSDNEVIAATFGRGLFSSDGFNGATPFTANFSANNVTPNTLQTVTLSDLTNLSPTSWTWTFTPNTVTYQGATNANSQNPQVKFNNTGVYTVSLQSSDGTNTDSEVKTNYINVSLPSYCSASSNSTLDEYISNVSFNTINNTTNSNGYQDNSLISTSVNAGSSYNLNVTYTENFATNVVKVWIDFNQDFDFTDTGEEFVFPAGTGVGSPYTLSIPIPNSAATGATRMRVRLHDPTFNPEPLPCGNSGSGEVEDYTINIQGSSSITWTNQPTNTTIECDESNLPVNTGTSTAITTCGSAGLNVTYSDATSAGSCANASTITRTWTATDNCGNSENFNQTITIQDNTAPSISCPATQSQVATNGVNVSLSDYTSMATISDNCSSNGNITVTQSPVIGSTQNIGNVTVTLTATDECGNTSNCNFTVSVTNGSSITWTNQPVNTTIECDESNLPVNTGTSTAITTCTASGGGTTVTYSDATAAGSCTNASTITRTWTATDNCGNSENFDQTITIEDNTAPSISCPATQSQVATNGVNVSLSDYTSMATISDNCSSNGNITVTQSPVIGSTQNIGNVTVTLTATDECGNTSNCNFTVSVTNGSSITWTNQPVNTTIECDESNLPVNTGTSTAITTCTASGGGTTVTYSDATAAGSCTNASTITRTWTATDNCGNSENFDQTITIEDNTPPTISCPTTQSQTATNGVDISLADYTSMATISDNCSSNGNITVTQSPAIGSTQNIGNVTVTLTATDECGNTSNCNFTVTVLNGTSITWTNQPTNTTIECDESNLPANTGTATATTTCAGSTTVTYSDATAAGSCANASTITRTWTATDNCGNSENFNQTITIQDNTAPSISCPATQSQVATNGVDVSLTDYTGMATISDNCSSNGNITVTQSPAISSTQNIGNVTVTLTATDECGNTSNCNFTVTVLNGTSITWTNQPTNTTIECDESNLPANTGTATATTTCAGSTTVTYSDATAAGSCANASTITRTWTATDNCGNSENFNQTITIQDNTAPSISCPATQSQVATNGVDVSLTDYTGMATISDNCSSNGNITVTQSPAISSTQNIGNVTVTLTATDECGNTSNCNFTVSVTNGSSITWTNQPASTTVECDESNLPANTGNATAVTGCGSAGLNINFTDVSVAGSCANAYTITRTWTATDNCGNSENFDQTITIEDNTAPTVTCPATQTQIAANGNDTLLLDYTSMAVISDNCSSNGNITVTQSPAIGSTQNVGTVNVTLTATDECGNSSNCNFDVDVVTSTGIADNTRVNIAIYPNPSKGLFKIALGSEFDQEVSVKIYNLLGDIVYNKEDVNTNGTYNLDLQHVEKGIYYVSIKGEKQTIIKKIMIM